MMAQTTNLEAQIKILEHRLENTPELIRVEGRIKYNPAYFSLRNMIKNKKVEFNQKKIIMQKVKSHNDWLEQ